MKKNSKRAASLKTRKKGGGGKGEEITIGLDVGDKTSRCCGLGGKGEELFERSVATTKKGMAQSFGGWGVAGSRWRWGHIRRG